MRNCVVIIPEKLPPTHSRVFAEVGFAKSRSRFGEYRRWSEITKVLSAVNTE